MAINEERPITLAEVAKLVEGSEKGKEIEGFIKKFVSLPYEKAVELKKEIVSLNILKLKEAHIVKIVDFLPKDATELNKILNDVSLDQEEVNKILDVVKKY
ncbi:hypothetical protein D6829_00810 [Candidatus Pacearchaeota archaeon]|nr:MAG: hypothetical protein D6829_00810 [Candidatus Pacearchaeota archaeon]